ncbi:MAG: hypothetical protein JW820_12735 [Spirochaetales bacterium]|nr:hypothetical protein [Spirochaetales bacterium]
MRRRRTAFRWTLAAFLLLFLGFPPAKAVAFPPAVVLGLYGSGFWFFEDDVSGGAEPLAEGALTASVLGGWRSALPWGGSLALSGDAALSWVPPGSGGLYDRESLQFQLYAPLGGLRLEVDTGLNASGLGTQEGLAPYLRPSWSVAGRWLGEPGPWRPFLGARGHLLLQVDQEESADEPGDEDAFYQGGVLGVAFVPSFESSYEIAVEAGWQRWLEQVLLDASGSPTAVPREDALARLRAGGQWLLGYFATGELSLEGGLRWSNANRLTGDPPSVLEANSESRWFGELRGELSWSPRRQLGLEGAGFLLGEWYLERRLPAPLAGPVSVVSGGLDLRLDWTPDGRWYFVLDASGLGSWSLDPGERGWNLHLQAGLELSL